MAWDTVSVTDTNASTIIPIKLRSFNYGVGLLVTFDAGTTGNVDVQVTGDELNLAAPTHWNKHDVLFNLSASKNSNLAYPVSAVRLKASSISGGAITLQVVQAGPRFA